MDFPVPPTLELLFCLKSLTDLNYPLSTPAPVELIFHQKFGGWEGRWFDDQG